MTFSISGIVTVLDNCTEKFASELEMAVEEIVALSYPVLDTVADISKHPSIYCVASNTSTTPYSSVVPVLLMVVNASPSVTDGSFIIE